MARIPDGPVSQLVTSLLREQVAGLKELEPAVLENRPDAVHQMRVTMRRMRSTLATFRPVLERDRAEALRDELRWLGGVLGEARDVEVMHERLRELIAHEPPELLLGPVAATVDTDLGQAHRAAHARAVEAMRSPRYAELLRRLDTFVSDPPWTPRADDPVGEVARQRMRNDWRRLRARARAADESADATVRRERLHEVRKAAKRARYAAEAMAVVYGDDAARFAKAVKRVQSSLGESRDSVVTQPVLRRLGVQAHLDGGNGFSYGRLHALEQARADEMESVYARRWRKASRRKLRRWFA